MNNDIQLLAKNQVKEITRIITRDIITPKVKELINDIISSDLYKSLIENKKESIEFQDRIIEATTYRDKKLQLVDLYLKAKEIDSTVYLPTWPVSVEDVEENYKDMHLDIDIDIKYAVNHELKLRGDNTTIVLISADLEAQLLFLPYDSYDNVLKRAEEIANELTSTLKNKYLYFGSE